MHCFYFTFHHTFQMSLQFAKYSIKQLQKKVL